MQKEKILFGFYKGLGDFISDAKIIKLFDTQKFDISIFVNYWLKDIASYIFPKANILVYKNAKDLLNAKYSYDYIFHTPNYLNKNIKINYGALRSYLIKYWVLKLKKNKNTKIIAPSYKDLFNFYLDRKKTYLHENFTLKSYLLLKKYFNELGNLSNYIDIEYKEQKPIIHRIIIFPFSGNTIKDYDVQNYLKIIEYLKRRKNFENVILFTTEQDSKKLKHFDVRIEVKSLVELAKIFKKNDLIISGDTGPVHLGTFFGANALILYGPTKPEIYKPIWCNGKIITLKSKSYFTKDIDVNLIIDSIEEEFTL